jgi:hypothetical protein
MVKEADISKHNFKPMHSFTFSEIPNRLTNSNATRTNL